MDSLDEVSTGGRVTRSLRKRLTSVDSDSNSRPSTPQIAKLTAIPEASSPLRTLRGTRRNSVSTNGTPSKGVGRPRKSTICEENETVRTPVKRNTRRGSLCLTDRETPKRIQMDNSLPKDYDVGKQSEINAKLLEFEVEVTPRPAPAINNWNKPGPKPRRSKHSNESDSDVEVINLEEKDINTKNSSQKSEEKLLKTPTRTSPRLQAKNALPKNNDISMETIDLSEETLECDENKKAQEQIHSFMQSINEDENDLTNLEDTNSNISANMSIKDTEKHFKNNSKLRRVAEPELCQSITTPEKGNSPKTNSKPLIESVVMMQKLSPKVIAKLCGDVAVTNSSPTSKSVTFNDFDTDGDIIKNTYPKTPASIKSKIYHTKHLSKDIEDRSFQTDKESVNSFKDAIGHLEELTEHADFGNQSKESIGFHDATNGNIEEKSFKNLEESSKDCTPHKQNLLTKLQSSTPMIDPVSPSELYLSNKNAETDEISSEKSPKKLHDSFLITDNKADENIFEAEDNKSVSKVDNVSPRKNEEKKELFSKSWTLTVSGNATSNGKIDTIVVPILNTKMVEVMIDQSRIPDDEKISSSLQKKNEKIENEEEDESFQKLEFFDNEAIDVGDNYESGDSMDDEERKEMLENEIIDGGESIGSEDTLSDNINEDEEENASFITSDSEKSVAEYSKESEHVEDDSKKTTKSTNKSLILSTSGSEVNTQSSDENEKKVANGISEKKKKLSKSNSRNRILSTSDSDVEEPTNIKNTTINNDTSIYKSAHHFNIELSRILDEYMDDEVVINEISDNFFFDKSKQQCDHNKDKGVNNVIPNKEFARDETKNTENDKSDVENDNNLDELIVSNFADINEDIEQANNSDNSNKLNKTTEIGSECTNQESSSICNELSISKKMIGKQKLDTTAKENEELLNNTSDSEDNENKQNKWEQINASGNSNNFEYESNVDTYSEEENIEIQHVDEQILEAGPSNESSTKETMKELSDENNKKKVKNSGLSVSFCPVKQKITCVNSDKKRKHHSSFTFGVSVIEPDNSRARVINTDNTSGANSSAMDGVDTDELKYLNLTKKTISSTNKTRKSMITLNAADISEFPHYKKLNRNSIHSLSVKDLIPSKSIIKTIEDRKHELNKERNDNRLREIIQNEPIVFNDNEDSDTLVVNNAEETNQNNLQSSESNESSPSQMISEKVHYKIKNEVESASKKIRLSKSFCGPIQTGVASASDSSASDLSKEEVENKIKANSFKPQILKANKNKKIDNSHIFERCDEILDAANRAKLESKKNYKKSLVLCEKSKKKSKLSLGSEKERANNKKNMKHSKEKTSQALKQAFKASAKLLIKEATKNKREKLLPLLNEEQYAEKRLPMQLLESLLSSKSQDEIQLNNKESRAPLVHIMNCSSGEIVEEILSPPKKKRAILKKIELPTGTVFEEPVTPKKKMSTGGFRESPITPRTIGFKVEHILSAGQDKVPEPLTSNRLKRKYNISDTQRVLPKPQWSQSGVFLEEPLPSINDNKIRKLQGASICGAGGSFATVNAMKFKNSALFRKNLPREASREILKRKERQYIRNYF